jgi:hypothetical protein
MRRIGNDGDARSIIEIKEIIENVAKRGDARIDDVAQKLGNIETTLMGLSTGISLTQKNIEDAVKTYKVASDKHRDDRVIIVASIFIAGVMHPYASFILAGVILGIIVVQSIMSPR